MLASMSLNINKYVSFINITILEGQIAHRAFLSEAGNTLLVADEKGKLFLSSVVLA
jgi:hypothetical protein